MTSLNLPERMNELSDGVIRPFNAMREGRRGSISEIPADDVMMAAPPAGDFSRPLCPWPQVARWTGKGSPRDAANFVCELKGGDRAAAASGSEHDR
jgi:hypothetical protein